MQHDREPQVSWEEAKTMRDKASTEAKYTGFFYGWLFGGIIVLAVARILNDLLQIKIELVGIGFLVLTLGIGLPLLGRKLH